MWAGRDARFKVGGAVGVVLGCIQKQGWSAAFVKGKVVSVIYVKLGRFVLKS